MNILLKTALAYKQLGISVIATDANKRSIQQWKRFQVEVASDGELTQMFDHHKAVGIATICGVVSGSMEVIDLDCKYDLTCSLFEDYIQIIVDTNKPLAEKLVIAKTVGGWVPYNI